MKYKIQLQNNILFNKIPIVTKIITITLMTKKHYICLIQSPQIISCFFQDPMILQGSTFFLSELSVVEEKCIPKKGSQSEWCGWSMSRQILSLNENLPFFNQ